MLISIIKSLLISIPLVLLPISFSVALLKNRLALPLHWWFGTLLIGLTVVVLHAVEIDPAVYSIIITVTVLGTLIWQRKALQHYSSRFLDFNHYGRYDLVVLTVLITIVVGGLLKIHTHPIPLGSDTFNIWLNKTKSIYIGMQYSQLPVVGYPSLIPSLQAFAMRFTGSYEPIYGLYFGLIAYCFWMLSFLSLIRQRSGWVIVLILYSISILFFDEYIINGYQDKIVMMTAGISALFFIKSLDEYRHSDQQNRSNYLFGIALFFASMLSLIKSEGTVMGLILFGTSLLTTYLLGPSQLVQFLKHNLISMAVFFMLILLWPLILYLGNVDLSKIQGDNLTLESIFDIPHNLERVLIIWPYFLNSFREIYLIFFLSLFLSIFALLNIPQVRPFIVYLWSAWSIHWVFIMVAFLSTRAPLLWHLDTAFNRLTSQHAFIYPLLILLVISSLLEPAQQSVERIEWKAS